MRGAFGRWVVVLGLVALVAAGCSSDGNSKKSSDTKATTTTKAKTPKRTMAATGVTDIAVPATCTADAMDTCPVIHVTGEGFTPGKTLGVTECADKGTDTGADDCNLGGIAQGKVGADGTIAIDAKVLKGPFGKNQIVCSATVKCLVSLGELVPDANAERSDNTVELSFAS